MPDIHNASMGASHQFSDRVFRISLIWDATAGSNSTLEGLEVMASHEALPQSVQPAAENFRRWLSSEPRIINSLDEYRAPAIEQLAKIAPDNESHWNELVAYAFAYGVILHGLNVTLDASEEGASAHQLRRDALLINYHTAKKAAGFCDEAAVARAAGVPIATVQALAKSGVVPRRATLERLAKALTLRDSRAFFRGLEHVPAWKHLFEDA